MMCLDVDEAEKLNSDDSKFERDDSLSEVKFQCDSEDKVSTDDDSDDNEQLNIHQVNDSVHKSSCVTAVLLDYTN